MYLYIRYNPRPTIGGRDAAHHQAFDERIFVRCLPQEILLSGSMGKHRGSDATNSNHHSLPSPAFYGGESLKRREDEISNSGNSNQWINDDPDNKNSNRILVKPLSNLHHLEEAGHGGSVQSMIDCRMDIMKGKISDGTLKPIDSSVDVGDEVTVIVRWNEVG